MKETRITRNSESGQASILLIIMLATFLLASLAFAVDFGNIWFHRQTAQTAADAACQAGAMDLLYLAQGNTLPSMGFTPGTGSDCTSSSGATMCWYAKRNGFSGAGFTATTAGSKVSWTFPASTSVTGVKASNVTNPFLKVTVQENIKTWFMGLLGKNYQAVGASCTCGLTPGPAPAPLIILHPTLSGALTSSGGTVIQISGGPQTSIHVDSNSQTAFACTGSGLVDTSTAGPNGTGGNLDLAGGPSANPTCGAGRAWNGGSTGSWIGGVTSLNQKTSDGTTMLNDPYKVVPAPKLPGVPAEATNPVDSPDHHQVADGANGFDRGTWVKTGVDSCPNTKANQQYMWHSASLGSDVYANCLEFTPGYYPTGIDLTSIPGAGASSATIIFMPGIYYLNGNLKVGASSTIRNAWPATQPSTQGVVFYFLTGAPQFSGGSGAANANINPVPSYYLNCSGTTTPSGMPSSLNGNVLVSQCSSGGTYVGSASTDTYSASGIRGLLFFLAHSNSFNGTVIGNGASLIFSGAFYFHNTSFQDKVQWDGAGTSTTYAIGNIVVDQLTLGGSGIIKMGLNGASAGGGPPLVGLFQ
jgi:hypothetical protein